ncbi:MAG: class I SAM-dependent methyltransferase, partial [Chloroflexi bacterium]|nr:class I SAM-dependent methyltransferase [Chloroflexota bacterium]
MSALVPLGRHLLGSRQINHLVRFEPVLEFVSGAGHGGCTLLDVGSGSRGIASLLPAWRTTALDASFDDYGAGRRLSTSTPNQVVGDVRALPFADRAFDVVVAVDLLEHLPPCDRGQAVAEICRVASACAVIACPAGGEALDADRRLARRLRARGQAVPGWLE